MAEADNKPSRIDQVFADPRWVGEALTAAAADAVDRHQRAGVRMVVFRDGRVEHVPAERLAPDVDALLKDVDFEAERSASELIAWFEERRSTINSCLLAQKPALLHQGRFKKFYEELYPFALWLGHLYAGRGDVICSLKSRHSAERGYDAVVKDRSNDPPTVTYVQLSTTTFDRTESFRMKKLLQGGFAPAYGAPDELECSTQDEMLKEAFENIARQVQRKSRSSYGPDYVLVISFDDFMWFGTADDRAALRSFVSGRLLAWHLNVAVLYVVGISGRTFEAFPIPPRA
jgi:hypothetical protein